MTVICFNYKYGGIHGCLEWDGDLRKLYDAGGEIKVNINETAFPGRYIFICER